MTIASVHGELETIVSHLGEAYDAWKGGEKDKNTYKEHFFRVATQALIYETLAEKVVEVKAKDEPAARDLISKRYPAWVIDQVREATKLGYYEAIIQENPELMSYTFEHDGRVWQRQVSSGTPYVDDERLQAEDPELWEEITFVPEPERQLRPLDELAPDLLARLQEYIFEGKPTVKLAAPRNAKT